jgi:nitrogen fixation/metabolism regulation signal transduction histidine kinase
VLFVAYLIVIHLVFACVCGYLFREEQWWLLAIEAFFVLSFLTSLVLLKKIYEPIELVKSGAEFIRESDFSVQLRPTGKKELDAIIEVYNQMMTALREERLSLTEKNFLLEKIMTASPSAVVILDFESRISLLNPSAERLFGNQAKSLVGKKWKKSGFQSLPNLRRLKRASRASSRLLEIGGSKARGRHLLTEDLRERFSSLRN